MRPWAEAMTEALYGDGGFYRRESPASHFSTSATTSELYAVALAELVRRVDAEMGEPATIDVVDVGAGDGALLHSLERALPQHIRARCRLTGVELRPPPPTLSPTIDWQSLIPASISGLIIASEWLDNVPLDVAVRTDRMDRIALVDPITGDEALGDQVRESDRAWLRRWWPLTDEGERAEIGATRDSAWGDLVGRLAAGVAVAIDYGHLLSERRTGEFASGTIAGYRSGRRVPAIPDGTCDITAHVAFDACAEAGMKCGAQSSYLVQQAAALEALGVHVDTPPASWARTNPSDYLEAMAEASAASELTANFGLGSHRWLLQGKGVHVKGLLTG